MVSHADQGADVLPITDGSHDNHAIIQGKTHSPKVARYTENVDIIKGEKRRRLLQAFLRYHDPNNWPLHREALKEMGRADLIGNSKRHLIATYQPKGAEGEYKSARKKNSVDAGDSVKRSGQTVQNKNQHKRPQKGRYGSTYGSTAS
ncbi:DUF3362 domain-containing protein [Acinetobacter baumannii]